MNLHKAPLTLLAILLSVSFLFAGNNSYYVNTDNDTIWGEGIWPKPGFDGQLSIMFVDADSNLLELKPDTVSFVVIEKGNHHEVFKSTKTGLWGQLFLHQVVIGDVAVLWGYDFVAGSVRSSTNWENRRLDGGALPTISRSHGNIMKALMEDPYPSYSRAENAVGDIMYYLQKESGKAARLYDINFKKQMSKYFAQNTQVLLQLKNQTLTYSKMGSFLSDFAFIKKEAY